MDNRTSARAGAGIIGRVPVVRSRPSRRLGRLLVVFVLVLLVGASATGCGALGAAQRPARPTTSPEPTSVPTPSAPVEGSVRAARERAVRVLSEWDARRSAALAVGDAAALRRLYVRDSPLARADVRMLRRYQQRGVRLTSVSQQVVSVQVRVSSARAVEVGVVERLAVAHVRTQGPGAELRPLATTRYARRELRFVRSADGWRLSSARAA